MKILSIYAPISKANSFYRTVLLTNSYHTANFSGGGLGGSPTFNPHHSISITQPSEEKKTENKQISNPRTIVQHLDKYVIGQDRAKKVLAVAIFNHYNRVRSNLKRQRLKLQKQQKKQFQQFQLQQQQQHGQSTQPQTIQPQPKIQTSNTIESGAEEVITVEHHHPTLPHEYYVSTQIPIHSTQSIEKEKSNFLGTQRRTWLNIPYDTIGLKENKENSSLEEEDQGTIHEKSNVLLIGPTGSGKTLLAKTVAKVLQVPFSMSDATPFTQAGYVGEDVELVIQRLLQSCDYNVKKAETGIIFIDEIDKISRKTDSHGTSRDVSGEGVQQSLLRMLEGTVVNITDKSGIGSKKGSNGSSSNKNETYSVDTSNILFILSGAFVGLDKIIGDRISKGSIGFNANLKSNSDIEKESLKSLNQVEPTDLVKYGLIPEFVGRIPVIANVENLKVEDLVRVLKEPKNSLLKQYESLFKLNNVNLKFSENALKSISVQALNKKTGARGLRRIIENLLLEPMYDAPGSNIKQIVINSNVVNKEISPIYITDKYQSAEKIIAEDDNINLFQEDLKQEMTQI